MHTSTRRTFGVLLCVLSAALVGASLAWACAPTNWGWAPPAAPGAETPTSGASGSTPASEATPAAAPTTSGGVVVDIPSQPAQRTVKQHGKGTAGGPAKSPTSNTTTRAFTPRVAPSSGIRTSGRGAAPKSASPRSHGSAGGGGRAHAARSGKASKSRHASSAANGSRPTTQAASGDLWSGFGKSSSLDGSRTGGTAPDGGPGGQIALGLALLGLGAVGLVGGLAVAEGRRRRRARAY